MNYNITSNTAVKSELNKISDNGGVQIYRFKAAWSAKGLTPDSAVKLDMEFPLTGIFNVWLPNSAPQLGSPRFLKPDWGGNGICSEIAKGMPLLCFYDNDDCARLTAALSETKKHIDINYGVIEKKCRLSVSFSVPLMQYTDAPETEFLVYIDQRELNIADSLRSASARWENDVTPMNVPCSAFSPLYSFWYSYHQEVYEKAVEEECKAAAEYGFKNVIVDDGWQTDDTNCGYLYCGDWEVCSEKISCISEHVRRVHKLGLKYIMWFSVPYLGFKSKNWERFKDKILYRSEQNGAAVLDPRYPDVREFLISVYENAVSNWEIDGLKLDFIDSFENKDGVPAKDGMDIPVLPTAADRLMTDISTRLCGLKNDILIEFRQNYVGPNMRKYGNMLRVADCPADGLTNRAGCLDLRLTSGNTAVHSDMLMWDVEDSAENAAAQIIDCIFAVVQISVKLESLPDNHRRMLKFWLDFMDKNKNLLLKSNISVSEPHLFYTSAKAYNDREEITAVYSNGKCAEISRENSAVINGTAKNYVICNAAETFAYEIYNCMGDFVGKGQINGFERVDIPKSGLAVFGQIL